MKHFSQSSVRLMIAADYGELICSVYEDLKVAIEKARKEKSKSHRAFCDSVGMKDTGPINSAVGLVCVMKNGKPMNVIDPDLWIEAIDATMLYMKENRGLECEGALKRRFFEGLCKADACGPVNYVQFANIYCNEFRYILMAEATARGLVDIITK